MLTTGGAIELDGVVTSGEIEPVLIVTPGRYYLGVGSDHTDRDAERTDIAATKAACPKPMGPVAVRLPSKLADFDGDSVGITSSAEGQPYQRGSLSSLLRPETLLDRLEHAPRRCGLGPRRLCLHRATVEPRTHLRDSLVAGITLARRHHIDPSSTSRLSQGLLHLAHALSEASFQSLETAADAQRYYCSATASAKERRRLLKLMCDFIGIEFADRQLQYEMFYSAAQHILNARVYKHFDWEAGTTMVDECLQRTE